MIDLALSRASHRLGIQGILNRHQLYVPIVTETVADWLNDGLGLGVLGLTPQQQPGSYQGGEMMMKSVFWWRKRLNDEPYDQKYYD